MPPDKALTPTLKPVLKRHTYSIDLIGKYPPRFFAARCARELEAPPTMGVRKVAGASCSRFCARELKAPHLVYNFKLHGKRLSKLNRSNSIAYAKTCKRLLAGCRKRAAMRLAQFSRFVMRGAVCSRLPVCAVNDRLASGL